MLATTSMSGLPGSSGSIVLRTCFSLRYHSGLHLCYARRLLGTPEPPVRIIVLALLPLTLLFNLRRFSLASPSATFLSSRRSREEGHSLSQQRCTIALSPRDGSPRKDVRDGAHLSRVLLAPDRCRGRVSPSFLRPSRSSFRFSLPLPLLLVLRLICAPVVQMARSTATMTSTKARTAAAFVALLGAQVVRATSIQSPALYQCTPAAFQYECS